jgi:hypothetical protein
MTFAPHRLVPRLLLAAFAALALAACETTGAGTGVKPEAAKPPEPPMTHTRAAEQCWMGTEKGAASMSLDKRADLVDKCIEDKMKGGSGAAELTPAPEAKKKKPATAEKKKPAAATADAQKKKPAAAADKKDAKSKDKKDAKDKKPADADAPDKKP